jgi:16S rRNA (cytidine1402-2'-O)-methyltransferase
MTKKRRSTRDTHSLADPQPPGNAPEASAALPHRRAPAKPATPPLELSVPVEPAAPGLHIVATPIGNLGDVSLRALATLAGVDLIACEDTRVTGRLLNRYRIRTNWTAYHEHNARRVLPRLIKTLQDGGSVALVSDAGTPLVSDPGHRLVEAVIAAGLPVTSIPGPAAAIVALTLAGLPADRFLFAGFLPPRSAARRRDLAELADVPASLVFYEAPHRLAASLADMADILGYRDAAVARELTKLHEKVRRDRLDALAAAYAAEPPRGEIVVIVGPSGDAADGAGDADALDARLREALATMSVRDAAVAVAAATGAKRRAVYARALALAGGADGDDADEGTDRDADQGDDTP